MIILITVRYVPRQNPFLLALFSLFVAYCFYLITTPFFASAVNLET